MTQALSFVHASDFHLDRPLAALTEIPPHLRERIVHAPMRAAERVFDLAVSEHVDFLVLSGDLLDLHSAGPRPMTFLLEQFRRLEKEKIAVYWAGGEADRISQWPDATPLPKNVHCFAGHKPAEFIHRRGELPAATIIGRARRESEIAAADLAGEEGAFTVAVAHGKTSPEKLSGRGVDYWALGGRHGRKPLSLEDATACYPGSPQGRLPEEAGPHGCLHVRVDRDGECRVRFVPCDEIRWFREQVVLGEQADRPRLENELRKKLREMAAECESRAGLALIQLESEGALSSQLRRGAADEVVSLMRREFGEQAQPVWLAGLRLNDKPNAAEPYLEEESILGDFLRSLARHESGEAAALDFNRFLPAAEGEDEDEDELAEALRTTDGEARQQALTDAAALAIGLLRGERA